MQWNIPDLLDIHKERISIAVAASGRSGAVDYLGEITSRWRFVIKQTVRLRRSSQTHKPRPSVRVVAPSLIPTKPGEPPLHRNTENPTATQGVV
jgi:transposase